MRVAWLSGGVSSFIAAYLDCYLDELEPGAGRMDEVVPQCGIMCELSMA